MRKILLLALVFVASLTAFGQDFSNKGKDFWLCFPQHVPNSNNNFATLSIFITSDLASTGTITMPNGAFSGTFSIAANGLQEIQLPWNPNIHIKNSESSNETITQILKKSIHIKTDPGQPAVVAYAQQWAGARSAATLLLPNNVLGKKYRAVSFTQNGSNFTGQPPTYPNPANQLYSARSQFQVIAINDNTDVRITPVKNGAVGTPFVINLPLAGDMIQYQSPDAAAGSQDLTGTLIESIASGSSGCLPIAVFSGSSNNTFGTAVPNCNGSSYDPLWQQCYPVSTWGKSFGFIPFSDYLLRGNPYRIMAAEDNTNVYFDGTLVATLNAGQIYPATYTSNPVTLLNPTSISADKPISVAQYAQADACSGQSGGGRVGDPDMVILNPIEQNISDITIFSSNRQSITRNYINVLIQTVAAGTFRINGAVPSAAWQPFPTLAGYSYLRQLLGGPGSYRLSADSGFNAIAYGWGNVESYAYSAGTNVRDLNTKLEISNPNSIDPDPSACTNSPFRFKVYFADSTNTLTAIRYDSIKWEVLANASNFVPNNFPVMVRPIPPSLIVEPDSVNTRNGKYVAWYSLPSLYYVTAPGIYPIRITLYRSNSEGCGNSIEYPFNLTVTDPPTASFNAVLPGCYLEPVVVTETTPQIPKATYKLWWEFFDPVTNVTTVYTGLGNAFRTISHTFTTPGVKRIRHSSITTPGCLSDTIVQNITLPDIPNATINGNTTVCINTGTVPVTFTGTLGTAEYIFSYNINGGATLTTPPSTGGSYTINAPTNVAGPFTYNLIGVRNQLPAATVCTRVITGQSVTVNITPDATVTLRPGDNDNQTVCINNPIINIRYDVGGSGTGGAVSGLPAGVTGTYAAGVITITGTPTAPGVFNYTVTTTGPCLTPQATGTITVTDNATITLTSGAGSNNQTLCINTPLLVNITYAIGGSGTGGSVSGLPAGVTGVYGGGVMTISGTPTAPGVFNYTVTTTGPCLTPQATGTITVTGDGTLTLTSAAGTNNQTRCINVAITNITYAVGGTGTGGSVSGLPAGVTGVFAGGVITISGTPTAPGVFNYTVTSTGPCIAPQATGTITVNNDATIALTSAAGTNNQTICINTAITDIDYLVAGGGTGATIAWTPGVPPGISFIPLGGGGFRITGILGATGTFNYTINTTGPCINPTAAGSITANPDHTIAFNGGTPNPTLCVNTVMPAFTLLIGGGATGITSAGLPPGVTATAGAGGIVTIAGTPTLAGSYNYTITTTGNSCIPATYTNTIVVTDNATINLISGSPTQTVCRNIPIADIDYTIGASATGATISWVPSAPTGITFTPVGANGYKISGTPTVVGTQTYTYTIQTTGPCVNPTATGSITVNALPVASFTAAPIRCANRDISFNSTSTLNAAIATYAWDFGDPPSGPFNTSTLQNPTHNYLVPNTTTGYTVRLTVTNSNTCVSNPVASMVVMVNDTPRADFLVPDVCINDVATVFTDISTINPGNFITSWFWDFGDPPSGPLNTQITQNGTHLYPSPNNYTVLHKAISSFGCRDSITHVITINAADPVSNFTVGNSCSSDSVSLVNLSTVSFGNVTRVEIYWDNVGAPGTFQTINAPVFNGVYKHKYPTLTTTRNYVIRMIAYSGNVCFTQLIRPTTVYATPVVQFNNIPSTCYLVAPFLLTQGSEIGGVPGTGTYSGPGITNPNGTFNPQVAGIGTHNIKYTWTASNPGACIDTLTRTITVVDTAHATFGVTLPSCEQTPTLFTNLSTAPASVILASTVWDFGDATGPQTIAIANPVTHTYANPGTYTVTMHTLAQAPPTPGCLSTDTTAVITIDANHHITWDAASGNQNQPLCVNTAITPIRYTLSGGATNVNFIPSLPPGLTYTVAGSPLTLTIQGAPTVPAGYTFGIQTTGNTCTIDNASVTISVAPDHAIALRAGSDTAQSVCLNTPIDDIYYDLSGGATGVNISGLPTGVTYSVTGNELRIYGTPTAIPATPGYSITTTGNTCLTASRIGEIFVHPYSVPSFTVDKPSYCIPNAIVAFTNTTTPAPLSNNTYKWNFGDGAPEVFSTHATHWYTSGVGPFTVRLSATTIPVPVLTNGQPGCSSFTDVPMISIHPQPKADFVFNKPSVCWGDNVLITDNTDGKDGIVNQWHWDMGDGATRLTNPVTYTYADTITYKITMYSVNTFGCNSDTINKSFTVYPYPHRNAGPDKFVLEGGSVELEATAYAREPQYAWTPVEYLTDSKILRPRVVNPKTDMTYRLTVTGKGGCAISDDVFVKLLKFPVIPNTFTPNGDGINDTWRIDFLNTYPSNRVQIFTRSGNLVFESRGYNTPWDGTLKGKPMPFDTYYYIIEPGNGRDPITGYVTILK